MPRPQTEQLTRLHTVGTSGLAHDVTAFLVDRQARGLSVRTVQYYGWELRRWQAYLEARGLGQVQGLTADRVRQYLLYLQDTRNAGGVHCAYRAMRTFLRWAWSEYELPQPCPTVKVHPPKLCHEPCSLCPCPT